MSALFARWRRPVRSNRRAARDPNTCMSAARAPWSRLGPVVREATRRLVPSDLAHLSDEALVALVARADERRSPSSTTGSAASPTGSRSASCATRRSPRTPSRRRSSASGARRRVRRPSARRPRTWILTLVHRRAVDLVRREERRRAEPLDDRAPRTRRRAAEDEAWATPRARARPGGAPPAAGPAARGDRARLLRRLHAVRAGRPAGPAPRHHQEPDVRRALAIYASCSGRGRSTGMERWTTRPLHELTAAYALDALDARDEQALEEHLRRCAACRDGAGRLPRGGRGARLRCAGEEPPPPRCASGSSSGRGRSASNVVPLRPPAQPRWSLGAAARSPRRPRSAAASGRRRCYATSRSRGLARRRARGRRDPGRSRPRADPASRALAGRLVVASRRARRARRRRPRAGTRRAARTRSGSSRGADSRRSRRPLRGPRRSATSSGSTAGCRTGGVVAVTVEPDGGVDAPTTHADLHRPGLEPTAHRVGRPRRPAGLPSAGRAVHAERRRAAPLGGAGSASSASPPSSASCCCSDARPSRSGSSRPSPSEIPRSTRPGGRSRRRQRLHLRGRRQDGPRGAPRLREPGAREERTTSHP